MSESGRITPGDTEDARQPSDAYLLAGVLAGDAAALRTLIARYDSLVRYTVFRISQSQCRRDPQWLDSLAVEAWQGLVQSVRRRPDDLPSSLAGYLARIARNRCISARRKLALRSTEQPLEISTIDSDLEAETQDPGQIAEHWDSLAALQDCVAALEPADRALTTELPAITGRKWKQAAQALEMSESTLRSRWARVLESLRRCVATKTGISLAPASDQGD